MKGLRGAHRRRGHQQRERQRQHRHAGADRAVAEHLLRPDGAEHRRADERDRAKFKKAASYMVLLDDKVMCKNMRCRKRFDISGIKTTAFI